MVLFFLDDSIICGEIKLKRHISSSKVCRPRAYTNMELYNKSPQNSTSSTKNTLISFTLKGDGAELFEYDLPYPLSYTRQSKDIYRVSFALNGTFNTIQGIRYLNDVLARFTLSFEVLHTYKSFTNDEGVELSEFQGLKSIAKYKNYEKVDNGQDNIFWSIKLYTEALIKESGGLVAYSLLESFAFNRFMDRAKDKSTLKAKCRSIWEWYDVREWVIPKRYKRNRKQADKELSMSRAEGARKATKIVVERTKKKVLTILTGMFKDEYKNKRGKWNISKIAKDSGTSRNTVMKYVKEYENEL